MFGGQEWQYLYSAVVVPQCCKYLPGANLRDNGSWQFAYMMYLGLIIGGGTNQIQKNIIAERGLGLPKAPKIKEA